MAKTAQLGLSLLAPAQAQKHVTVNEALAKLDAVAQLRLLSTGSASPPDTPKAGDSYVVAQGASGEWTGEEGRIATYVNGGWLFTEPRAGWRGWDESAAGPTVFNGREWLADAVSVAASGAASMFEIRELDHEIKPGTSSTTAPLIPTHGVVLGITARVLQQVNGASLTSWRLGVPESDDRYGTGLGLTANSFARGLTSFPLAYCEDTPLMLSPEGGIFSGGLVRLAVHLMRIEPPREI